MKKLLIAVGVLAGIGAAAAIAQGHREGRGPWSGRHGDRMGLGADHGFGPGGDMGRHGMFGRSMTQDEFDARTRERFARLDKNSDGVLELAEIEAGLASHGNERRRGMMHHMGGGEPGDRLLRRFDTSKDGKVTREEFQAEVRKAFAEMDLNSDGRIDDTDLPPMMRGRNVLAGEGPGMGGGRGMMGGGRFGGGGAGPMLGVLRGADANKDGVITLDEALAHAGKEFDRFDRNKDAAVDKADFDALRKEMTDYRVKRFVHAFGGDKDSKVTKDQFYAKAKERFARMDANADGRLDREDFGGRPREGLRDRMQRWMGHDRGPGAPAPGTPPPKQ
jgi:Ca2+-binding EF-hand superfamily protein